MTSVFLMLLLPVIRAQRVFSVPSCPASCAVCSEDAVICQRLEQIIDAPNSTQALLLTEGSISSVQAASLADLSNVTVIGLSHNHISDLGKDAFRNLPFLHTLLLDHNLLTGQALQGGALANLTQLEVLALGHNLIGMIEAGWFRGTTALLSLKLEGNLLTNLDFASLPLNDLRKLEILDLSDNLIGYLAGNSFVGLVSLRTLDLSRNRLSSAPAEAFSYLSWLTNLNLDLNSWNCSCELLELSAILSAFIQQPNKTLYNGRRMVCVSADNPAVTTVLELTEANCVPSNQNIRLLIETRNSVTPHLYARDVAITAVICFIGGVGLTLFIVLIYFRACRKKKQKESQSLKVEEETSGTVTNHMNHNDDGEGRRNLQANRSLKKDAVMSDAKTNGRGVQFRSRADRNGGYFQDPYNHGDGANPVRRDNWMNGGLEVEGSRNKRLMVMMEEERGRAGFQQRSLSGEVSNQILPQSSNNFHSPREIPSQRMESFPSRRLNEDVETKIRGQRTLNNENSQRTYRPPEQGLRQVDLTSNPQNSSLLDDSPLKPNLLGRTTNGHHQSVKTKHTDRKQESRNVTFDPDTSKAAYGKTKVDGEVMTSGDKQEEGEKTQKVQSSHLVKVKLNLNPLRKSKVHPKRRKEQSHMEKGKRSKEKRKHEKERGKMEGKLKSSKGKSSKTSRSGEDEKKDKKEKKGEAEKIKNEKNKNEEENQEGGEQAEVSPECSKPSEGAVPANQPGFVQPPGLQAFQYQGAGFPPGRSQLSQQQPFSFISTDRNRTGNLSLLGPTGSQLTGSSLSLQTGNALLNTTGLGSNPLLLGVPSNPTTSALAFSGPNTTPRGTSNNFIGQTPGGMMSSVSSLLGNNSHTNPMKQTSPFHTSQAEGLSLALPGPVYNSVQSSSTNQLPTEVPLVAALLSDQTHSEDVKVGGPLQLPTEAPVPKASPPDPGQGDTSEVTALSLETVATLENISNNNSQTETARVQMPVMGTTLSEGSVPGGSVESEQIPGGSGSSVSINAQTESSPGAALLQQEYLPEEAGSSPRRKLRLVIPEKTSSRPPTALEKKIR